MKIYKQLQLTTEQRSSFATRWHSWCRRRSNLDAPFNAAVLEFQKILEPSKIVAAAALSLANVAANEQSLLMQQADASFWDDLECMSGMHGTVGMLDRDEFCVSQSSSSNGFQALKNNSVNTKGACAVLRPFHAPANHCPTPEAAILLITRITPCAVNICF